MLDGEVGALILQAKFFVTSANQPYIPNPPLGDQRQVQLRANSLYGNDDPILWPQPYMPFNAHFAAIPRPNSLEGHDIIWWHPEDRYFEQHSFGTSPFLGLGKLVSPKFKCLEASVTSLLKRIEKYASSSPAQHHPPTLKPYVKWLEHGLVQLQSVYTTFQQMVFIMRSIQRVWLETTALLDYMEVYKPRMDGHSPPAACIADTIGAFTNSIQVAQDFFTAGLPCWLIKPTSTFVDQNILNIVELFNPTFILDRHPFPYPVIFKGPASAEEKYNSIHRYARNFLRCPDPFNATSVHEAPMSTAVDPVSAVARCISPHNQDAAGPSQSPSLHVVSSQSQKPSKQGRKHACSQAGQFSLFFLLPCPHSGYSRSTGSWSSQPRQIPTNHK